jgi:hypothetical protein
MSTVMSSSIASRAVEIIIVSVLGLSELRPHSPPFAISSLRQSPDEYQYFCYNLAIPMRQRYHLAVLIQ